MESDLTFDQRDPRKGPVFLSGIQALATLPILQRQRDTASGLNTAGFISGYRGSPLGTLDQVLWNMSERLQEHHVQFQPGINEDLAATMVWGTQQVNLLGKNRYDGVFGMWYAKGPGVDRSMDVLKHANAAGTSRHGGVLAIAGDDHGAKSSSLPHQSEHMLASAMIPVLTPAGVQEYLDLGIHGWAMSRYSGCWVGLKATADTVESSACVEVDPGRVSIVLPENFEMPIGGVNLRWPDPPLEQELRLQQYKTYAALAYARVNKLNRITLDSPQARFGIISSGKAYLDVLQALHALGIDAELAAQIGVRVYKIGMNWPLDAQGVRHFAEGLEEILVAEEKRQVIEYQLKEQLYSWREDVRPRVIGKYDEKGEWEESHREWQLPAAGELTPAVIARVIAGRIDRFHSSERIKERLTLLAAKEAALAKPRISMERVPHYCSGCPHNTSTLSIPEGSRVLAGIGCHYMALWLTPTTTQTFSQMGGEGVAWAGQAPFVDISHVFANLGDGTYQHSGLLAIRQAVSAKARITYKILYNDAVAMTGGQPVEGALSVPMITQQLAAEGVGRIVVVTDQPKNYAQVKGLAAGVRVLHRRELDRVQRELKDYAGVSALVYDQTCAAEKRRRRKEGKYPDPPLRPFINERVCEGCGDCSAKSNCMSVVPVETEFGRKRAIDQSSCNKDFSCIEGFCPSFVTVTGGRLRKGKGVAGPQVNLAELPEPELPAVAVPYGILVTGVGGTGVVTIGTLLGIAANIEKKAITVLDMAGLAQKGGPVWSHIRIAERADQLFATRIAAGEANALIGCDIVVSVANDTLVRTQTGLTKAVVNRDFSITSDFVRTMSAQANSGDVTHYRDPQFPVGLMEQQIVDAVGEGNTDFVAATRLATALLGDSIATNPFMLGFAYQKGLLPVSADSLIKAIEMHGIAVASNVSAFVWGRRAAHDLAATERIAASGVKVIPESHKLSDDLDQIIARRTADLTAYQNAAYAQRYTRLVDKVRAVEKGKQPLGTKLSEAVARNYYKVLAYKDEYEVARLYSDPGYLRKLNDVFEGEFKLVFHLAPPLWAKPDPRTGTPRKRAFGRWMLTAFGVLAKFKGLRGTPFDPFGYTKDRKLERQLLSEYEKLVQDLIQGLDADNLEVAVELASLPGVIRGYGHIKERHVTHAKRREAELLATFRSRSAIVRPDGPGVRKSVVIMAG